MKSILSISFIRSMQTPVFLKPAFHDSDGAVRNPKKKEFFFKYTVTVSLNLQDLIENLFVRFFSTLQKHQLTKQYPNSDICHDSLQSFYTEKNT